MVLAFLCLLPSTLISLTAPVSAQPHPVGSLEGAIDYDRVLEHVRYLSGLGSRVTGYPGSYSASRYISDVLKSYGLNVTVQTYKVVVPIDEGATITLLSPQRRTIKAHALWPNSVQTSPTPPEGVTGRLIYVGDGDLEDFDGKEVEGAIALMDFNSGDNWINAAKLGAKAVIFIEPPHTTYLQCMKKFLDTPVHFPRLYVTEADGLLLREASGNEVRVVSRMRYAEVTAENVIGIVNGTHPQDAIIVSSHYDSWSVVPALSTGANEAVSIAYLLELARYIKEQQPLRSVWFVAFSGHWQGLEGPRNFVEEFFFDPAVQEDEVRI
ncbi:TPA: M28 family peptidase, partial [Candidatus Bathyarchaeota archaeon]|nr:M28 family peptidase [Candidatus Bathyarchaeota archaeon]